MKIFPILFLLAALMPGAQAKELRVENSSVRWLGEAAGGKFRPLRFDDLVNGRSLTLTGECFQLVLGDGTVLKSSDFLLEGVPETKALAVEASSPVKARHFPGQELVAKFSATGRHLAAQWRALTREGGAYVRQELTLRAVGADVLVKEIVLFEQGVPGGKTAGTVDGSPVTAGGLFLGYEHPMSQNLAGPDGLVRCGFSRNALLKDGETLAQSLVLGAAPQGQMRRGFLDYVERERAHPYRPFLHYNSWYDIAWHGQKYDQDQCLEVIRQFGGELAKKRGVKMSSFLLDDGWDDNKTLWGFHKGFPDGFKPLKAAAAEYGAGIGVWISPFGGYAQAKEQRLKYGAQAGFETNASGFSLAGPEYFKRFQAICLEMVQKYGVNQFKFDGLAAGAKAADSGLTRDGDAMLRLIAGLRAVDPDLYINQTVGTWPSPFWLLNVDSTWRGGEDHAFAGKGTWCQQWMTYRDAQTYLNVVQRGPLYPLNALMLHGIIYAAHAEHLAAMSDTDFADQVREFFGNGTQLQEMYVTPGFLNKRNWDDLANAANWSRDNADVLVDTHWVGGDPGQGQVYGFAAWSPRRAILVLRNPGDKKAEFSADAGMLFELPQGAKKVFEMESVWNKGRQPKAVKLKAGEAHTFTLGPLETLVLQTK